MDLFSTIESDNKTQQLPLAARMRPKTLKDFVGQKHILGPGKLLRRLIDCGQIGSVLLYGPPGTGKTTLAHLIANETKAEFRQLNAVTSGVKELREVLNWADDLVSSGASRPIVFIDEIHRFNRSQQDALLPDVENGIISLVGATTSNPFFAVNGALLSRSQVFQLEPLESDEIRLLIRRALEDRDNGLEMEQVSVSDEAIHFLTKMVEGDARRAISALEIAIKSSPQRPLVIDTALMRESVQQKTIQFDPTGDQHYDLASALIKSIRGCDVDAALYWLARALESGEDIRFLCRRLVILASEDVGLADSQALTVALNAMHACEFIGLPECQWALSQAVIYLALAPKSNSATSAVNLARKEVKENELIPVPKHLRDGHYQGAAHFGHGVGYQYSHDAVDAIAQQEYLGVDIRFYEPSDQGSERELGIRWQQIQERLNSSM